MIAGVDEAGRGALAGPVVAAAVILPDIVDIKGLADSKKLSAVHRERIYDHIFNQALYIGIGMATHRMIDRVNILEATMLAMKKAILRLKVMPEMVLVDGNKSPNIPKYTLQTIIKGDETHSCISAASIVAKVIRDRLMTRYHYRYPRYEFNEHKGYATKRHYDLLLENGKSPIHREGFNLNRQSNLLEMIEDPPFSVS